MSLEQAVNISWPLQVDDSAAKLRVIEADFRDARCLEFISSQPNSLVYHHPSWLSSLEQEYGSKCLYLACEDSCGNLQGVLPLFYTRGLPLRFRRHQVGRRLSSLPRTPMAGPIAASAGATAALLKAAMDRVRSTPGVQLEIKTTLPGLEKLVEGLSCVRWRDTYVRGLPENTSEPQPARDGVPMTRSCGPCEECHESRFGNAHDNHQVKWAVNKALKQSLRVRLAEHEDELREWYDLYLSTMRRNVVPARSYRFFQFLWKHSRRMLLYLVEHNHEGKRRLVSGSIVLMYGNTAFWAFTGSEESDFSLHPNDLTLWHALHDSCERGYKWFDLGEVAENHPELARFKAKWGTVLVPMYRYYYPRSHPDAGDDGAAQAFASRVMSRFWPRMPLRATEVLGDWIFSYL